MELSPLLLSKLLFYSFILGIALGILNDIWRITRVFFGVRYSSERFERLYSRLKMKREYNSAENKLRQLALNVIIFLQDLVFMIIAAVGIVFLNYYLNDGEIRLFTVISAVIGCALWYMSFGKLVIMFSEPIVMLIKFMVYTTVKIISTPVRYLVMFAVNIYKKILFKVRKAIANSRNIRYNIKRKKYYTEISRFGFLGKDF